MNKRLEAFSDGVFAIAITLLILEIKVPPLESVHSVDDVWNALAKLWPSVFAFTLSFMIIFISWVGHHNLFNLLDKTSPQFQFANGFFLLTVVVIPFPTAFMAEYLDTPFAQPAIVVYCLNSVLHNIGWVLLNRYALKPNPLAKNAAVIVHLKRSSKGAQFGFVTYSAIAILALWFPYTMISLSTLTWIYWLYLSISIKEEIR